MPHEESPGFSDQLRLGDSARPGAALKGHWGGIAGVWRTGAGDCSRLHSLPSCSRARTKALVRWFAAEEIVDVAIGLF